MTPFGLDIGALLRDAGLLLLATLLGGAVGWQREARGRAAGLRTHVLVCLGSCLITLVSFRRGDPGRIAAQIVSGIGFLGAGVILRRGVSVRGLTTAATIWTVAGIGLAVGSGGTLAALAALATVLVLLTLTLAKRLETAIGGSKEIVTLSITLPRHVGAVGEMIETLTGVGADVVGYEVDEAGNGEHARTLLVSLRLRQDVNRDTIARALLERLPKTRFAWETSDAD